MIKVLLKDESLFHLNSARKGALGANSGKEDSHDPGHQLQQLGDLLCSRHALEMSDNHPKDLLVERGSSVFLGSIRVFKSVRAASTCLANKSLLTNAKMVSNAS